MNIFFLFQIYHELILFFIQQNNERKRLMNSGIAFSIFFYYRQTMHLFPPKGLWKQQKFGMVPRLKRSMTPNSIFGNFMGTKIVSLYLSFNFINFLGFYFSTQCFLIYCISANNGGSFARQSNCTKDIGIGWDFMTDFTLMLFLCLVMGIK